jgi:hypothetical protein
MAEMAEMAEMEAHCLIGPLPHWPIATLAYFSASIIAGTTSKRSPTMP